MKWLDEPPDDPQAWLLVWDASRGQYRLLEPLGKYRWCRHDRPTREYDVAKLVDCAARSGWRFQTIVMPAPPDDEWVEA